MYQDVTVFSIVAWNITDDDSMSIRLTGILQVAASISISMFFLAMIRVIANKRMLQKAMAWAIAKKRRMSTAMVLYHCR